MLWLSGFRFPGRTKNFLFSETARPALDPTQPPCLVGEKFVKTVCAMCSVNKLFDSLANDSDD
jgi:hypothetical protein